MSSPTPGALAEWPRDGLEHVDRCPACGGGARTLLYSDLSDRTYLAAPGTWQLFECSSCGAAYLDPRPDARTLHLAFTNFYEGDARSPRDAEQLRGLRRVRRALRNGYLEARYGYNVRPRTALGRYVLPLLPHHREEADELVRHLPRRSGPARVLDVGCGEGDFLATMTALGWEAEGLEPTADAVRIARARGLTVMHGALPDATLPAEAYAAVTFRLVLEYLRDSVAGLVACREALVPGGILWIASPSLQAIAHEVFGPDWVFLETPRHAVLFTPDALARLLARLGFDLVAMRASRRARWSFRTSHAIRLGLPPFRQPPPLPPRLALHARLADVRALRRPERADVVVLVARKR